MAVSFSNHSLLPPPYIPSSFSAKPSKTLQAKTPSLALSLSGKPFLSKPITAHLLSSSSQIANTKSYSISRSFKAYLAAQGSSPPTTNAQGKRQNDAEALLNETYQDSVPGLKNLIKIYMKAILDGDEKSASDVEALIDNIEIENTKLIKKVSSLSEEITSGKEKYIRLQADFDNFRKRSEKERINIRNDAQGEVIETLLPMVDSFERAKQQVKPETEMEKKIDTSYQGIYKQFVEIMRSLKVATVPTIGKPFDPSFHEAIAREASEVYEEGIIIQEFRRGFLLGNRLIRPAMVKVSSGPGTKKAAVGASGKPAAAAGLDERILAGLN